MGISGSLGSSGNLASKMGYGGGGSGTPTFVGDMSLFKQSGMSMDSGW